MTYGNLNVDTVTTSTAGGILGAGNASIMKNRFINGAMAISQSAGGSSISVSTDGVYPVDRFRAGNGGGGSGVFSAQQSTTAPAGFYNSLALTVTTADSSIASTDWYYFRQWIEQSNVADLNWGTANAQTVTLSFWVRSSVTGTYGACVNNSDYGYDYAFSYTINASNTWEYKTVTITGLTTGTVAASNGRGFGVSWALGAGSNYTTGTVNSWYAAGATYVPTGSTNWISTSGATFYITGVQLEVGSSATGFEYVNYQTSLANCQRYFWRKSGVASAVVTVGSGMAYNTTDIRCTLPNPVTMRSTPTVSFTGSNYEYEKTASSRGTLGSVDATARSVDASTLFSGSGTTATTAGQGAIWYITDSASYISISAEL